MRGRGRRANARWPSFRRGRGWRRGDRRVDASPRAANGHLVTPAARERVLVPRCATGRAFFSGAHGPCAARYAARRFSAPSLRRRLRPRRTHQPPRPLTKSPNFTALNAHARARGHSRGACRPRLAARRAAPRRRRAFFRARHGVPSQLYVFSDEAAAGVCRRRRARARPRNVAHSCALRFARASLRREGRGRARARRARARGRARLRAPRKCGEGGGGARRGRQKVIKALATAAACACRPSICRNFGTCPRMV
jgi:hypothetical protein